MNEKTLSIIVKAQDNASKVLDGVGDKMSALGSKMVSAGKVAAAALAAAAVAATGFAIKSAADFEQTRIGLQSMLGSADNAREVLKEVYDFASKTPFEFPELAQAVKQLTAFGFNAKESVATMKLLGDVSSAVGTPMGDLAYLFGTLRSQGRAFTIDIRQFAMRGIPIYEYLAKVLEVDVQKVNELIEAGKVGFPEVQRAFQAMTAEGGKFHGAMAMQSQSLTGLFSTLKDTIGSTARELVGMTKEGDVVSGSVFDRLRIVTSALIENLPRLIQQMKDIVTNITPQMQQWAANVIAVAHQIGDYLRPKVQELWAVIRNQFIPELERLWREVLQPLIPVIGVALVVALGIMIDYLRLSIAAAAAFSHAAGAMAHGVVSAFNWVRDAVTGTMQWGRDRINEFKGLISGLPGFIRASLAGIASIIFDPFGTAFSLIKRGIEEVREGIRALKNEAASIKSGSANIGQRILDPLKLLHRAHGGPVSSGRPYIVGENEPELFVPNQSGQILNQQQMSEAGVGGSTFNMYGTINLGSSGAVDRFFERLDAQKEMGSLGVGV